MAKTRNIQSRIDAANFHKLIEHAETKGISISLLVRIILMQYLEAK